MTHSIHNVLFLCTGNSARSVIAEALLNVLGQGRFRAFSAGSQPTGRVQPMAAGIAARLGYDPALLRSKCWDEFARPDAPRLDLVITVCGSAAGETCPMWPGTPITAHWGVEDPAAVSGDDATRLRAYEAAEAALRERITEFLALPIEHLDRETAQARIRAIGAHTATGTPATGKAATP